MALRQRIKSITAASRAGPRDLVTEVARQSSLSLARRLPLDQWPYALGRAHDIKLYGRVRAHPTETTGGSANINILVDLARSTLALDGDVAEAGVWKGSTLVGLGYLVQNEAPHKRVLGFDSFEGFDAASLAHEASLAGQGDAEARSEMQREALDFTETTAELVVHKLDLAGVRGQVDLVPGFFEKTLATMPDRRFCFVHLDCDLYDAYRVCLDYFYPRLSPGGIILFDEYDDPVYPGGKLAVDEFLEDKPESLLTATSDNQIRRYLRRDASESP